MPKKSAACSAVGIGSPHSAKIKLNTTKGLEKFARLQTSGGVG
jgi:hypothetical protein